MNPEQIDKTIEMLENVRKRVRMYIGKVDVDLTVAWLNGFEAGLWVYEDDQSGSLKYKVGPHRCEVMTERGWKINALHHASQMQERGMTPEAVVDELLVVEIEVWKRIAKEQRLAAKRSGRAAAAAQTAQTDGAQEPEQ